MGWGRGGLWPLLFPLLGQEHYISTCTAAKVGKSFSLYEHTKGFSSRIPQLYILL